MQERRSTRDRKIGWYEGFSLLAAVGPSGVIPGFCFGAASTADQPLAETFFALRAAPNRRLLSVGSAFLGTYVADKGFEGAENHRRWLECYGAEVIHPPKRNSKKPWSKPLKAAVIEIGPPPGSHSVQRSPRHSMH